MDKLQEKLWHPHYSCLEADLKTGIAELHMKNDGTERHRGPDSTQPVVVPAPVC
ncbi:rCG44797 [Rattus norvegicus]|uniref:RCG44797 n=1 Tax=Rattus norvegicus TaxID=10116 RepID=A6I5J0_RAT|nr:rCG44797 [Rattus norvegicus]